MTQDFTSVTRRLQCALESVIRGKPEAIRHTMIALIAGGHVLLDDVPGTGKTTLAKALAVCIGGIFRRIQFTPDLLPADIIGSNIYNPVDGSLTFREGPVFANVVLADEINRSSPRTQSALLEVMSENQITIDGMRRTLPQPFFVIATQNPSDYHGTYPLPEAQLDRFAMRVTVGYPDIDTELEILSVQSDHNPLDELKPILAPADLANLQHSIRSVRVDKAVAEYIVKIIHATRTDTRLRVGISPRGSLTLFRTVQARAALEGRDFALPEDVRALAVSTLAHRLTLDTKSRYGGVLAHTIIEEAVSATPIPR